MTVIKNTKGKGLQRLEKYINQLAADRVFVGVTRGTNGVRGNAMIAFVMEFGSVTKNIPERSYLRSTIHEQSKKYANIILNDIPTAIKNGSTAYDAYSKLGTIVSNDVKIKIASGEFVALAPATIKRKKSSKPLIDTGLLRQSISYEIR